MESRREMGKVRQRRYEAHTIKEAADVEINSLKTSDKLKSKFCSGPFIFTCLFGLYAFSWLLIHFRIAHLPTPIDPLKAKLTDFVEKKARMHLDNFVGFGPRVAGSASSFAAEKYIFEEVSKIKVAANPVHEIEIDVQTVSGTFVLNFDNIGVGEYSSVYENQKNVIVKLAPQFGSNDSLLVNCHYDTVIDSPGTSDDAISCCVMLEVLRALSKEENSLKYNVIFLFNGAEENILQASHGFITQHKWAHSIRAFVNLDSAGAGGWELLFQTGPEHPWLIETYISSAPHPHASVVGQEIFQGGLVPADTDFRIFRDFGHIPGLDIAYIRNGYVYHTMNDLPQFVEPGCLQRGGSNLLALIKALASSPYLVDPGSYRHGSLVFFDFLGLFVVAYPKHLALILNWSTVAVVMLIFLRQYFGAQKNQPANGFPMNMVTAVGAVIVTWVVMLGAAVLMALAMTWIGKEMSYYSNQYNIIWVFLFPSAAAGIGFHCVLKHTLYKDCPGTQAATLYLEANMLIWSIILAVLTHHNVMSAYIPMLLIICPLVGYCFVRMQKQELVDNSTFVRLIILSTALPLIYILYMTYVLLMFFIPITGRMGTEGMPDVAIALMALLPMTMVFSFQLSLVYVSQHLSSVLKVLLGISLVGVLAVVFTPLGFPFSSKEHGSQQRMIFLHIDRQFHSSSGEVIKRESSLWLKPFDHGGLNLLEQEVPELFREAKSVICEGIYCGRPYLYPILSRLDARKTVDLPAPLLNVTRIVTKLLETKQLTTETRRMVFEMTGPDHVTIFFSPRNGVHVLNWTFGHGEPAFITTVPDLDDTYFVYYAYGEKPAQPWQFSIDFYVDPALDPKEPIVEFAFAGHYLHGSNQWTPTMIKFAQQLPHWMTPTAWSATLDVFQF